MSASTATIFHTHLGYVAAATRDGRVVAVVLPQPSEAEARAQLPSGCDFTTSDPLLTRLQSDLTRCLAGEPVDFSAYPVDLSACAPFQRAALDSLRRIPVGEVRTYAWVAEQAGNPKAARAAGQAMHANPIPLVLPCHRVVGSTGSLTGFGGGLSLKQHLLTHEGVGLRGHRVVVK